jgi:hypothetical protein
MNAAGTTKLQGYSLGGATFSPAHWAPGDRTIVFSYDNGDQGDSVSPSYDPSTGAASSQTVDLQWINLNAATLATTSGKIARNGDTLLAGAPSWSHDGSTIAYVSTTRVCTGRLGSCRPNGAYDMPPDLGSRADIYTVPYAGGAGGQATPLKGASDPSYQEYYPAYSFNDKIIAFNRIANDLNLYNEPAAELFVVPAEGGTAARLSANDPPQCTGKTSPGINNVWPKWGPSAASQGGLTYHWMIFSSKRYDGQTDQLYITAVVAKSDGTLDTSHGALYLWNQSSTENAHTPAWDKFKVPALPGIQ